MHTAADKGQTEALRSLKELGCNLEENRRSEVRAKLKFSRMYPAYSLSVQKLSFLLKTMKQGILIWHVEKAKSADTAWHALRLSEHVLEDIVLNYYLESDVGLSE